MIDSSAGLTPYNMNSCPDDGLEVTCMRTSQIHAPDGFAYPAYAIAQYTGLLGQYYDVQGSTWTGAPLLASPAQSVAVGGRTYELFYEGAHLRTIAWFEHGAVYWIHNTLLDSVGNSELLAIAEQTQPLGGATESAARARAVLRVLSAPLPPPVRATSSSSNTLGALAGLLSLIALPLLGYLWVRRLRELRGLNARLQGLLSHDADLIARAQAGVIPLVALQHAAPAGAAYVSHAIRLTNPTPPETPGAGACCCAAGWRSRYWLPARCSSIASC